MAAFFRRHRSETSSPPGAGQPEDTFDMPMHRLATLALVALTAAGCDNARKIVTPRGAVQNEWGCDQCHGYPPPAGVAGWSAEAVAHPQGDRATKNCHYCHPTTVEADNHTLVPASQGGHHQNGKIEYVHGHLPGENGVAYSDPSQHVPEALKGLARTGEAQDCYACHGADLEGGIGYSCVACHNAPHGDPRFPVGVPDFRVNCTFCHGTPKQNFVADADLNLAAPPDALYPHALNDPAIGAHQKHLGVGVGVACATCHTVPAATFPESFQHITGTTEVVFTGDVANKGTPAKYTPETASCATYCHGATMANGTNQKPKWTDGAQGCTACHGSPPQTGFTANGVVGWHAFHVTGRGLDCGKCHMGYVKNTSANAALHVNGVVDVVVDDGTAEGFRIDAVDNAAHNWSCDQCATCHTHLGLAAPTCQ
jgi:predicted CxxxxCH...CXXCH cytochrome family protein